MQIASLASIPNVATMGSAPESRETPGPDHDGDSDDKSVAKSAISPGVGSLVDTSA